ncbi:hypothetical protein R50073_18220 [Maricurvus nonylphenolicus]|uniref:molecular chaperone TorD family protein n=1 Tax=Maricurvus nonylphenolicus TaxID=1008307 RepID=UPI0036F2BF48
MTIPAMSMNNSDDNSLILLAWAQLWSPSINAEQFECCWRALHVSDYHADLEIDFNRHFHVGLPAPTVPLYLSASLNKSADGLREILMRAMSHLHLKYHEKILPADHLSIVIEITAQAYASQEDFILRTLVNDYLIPWVNIAKQRITLLTPDLYAALLAFEETLKALIEVTHTE